MKSIRMVMLFLIMVTLLRLLAGCGGTCECPEYEPTHFVDVYINEDQEFVTLEDDVAIKELFLFVGDILLINNRASDKVTVSFPDGMFDQSSVTIEPNKRARLKVLKAGTFAEGFKSTKDGVIIDGEPKVRVGEEP